MTDLGQVGAAAVTTIGTVAVVGIAAKTLGHTAKHVGRMPKGKGYRVLPKTKIYGSKKTSKKFYF